MVLLFCTGEAGRYQSVCTETWGENCDAAVEDAKNKASAVCAWYRINVACSTADWKARADTTGVAVVMLYAPWRWK
jgi:hypothetical protein